MAFDSLTEKLQNVFKNLRSKGRLTEDDVKAALREVKMALLEADVNFKVVKNFVKSVQERAVGQDVMSGLNPGQMVIKIVNDELVNLMGSETTEIKFQPGSQKTVIMMMGLQGAGKTTTTAKLAGKFKLKGKKPLLVACDVYRPAAIEQLQKNGEKQGVPVFAMGTNHKPVNIAKAALEHAAKNGNNVVIIDTAGRLHIDEAMMDGNARLNLATFVTTWMDDYARRVMTENMDKNMIDKTEYPQTAEIERRCVNIIAKLWHSPEPPYCTGTSTVGSSEACMLGGIAALKRWQKRRRAKGLPTNKPNFIISTCMHLIALDFPT